VAYDAFIQAHNHRGHQDRDFYYYRRVENPALDYDALSQLLDTANPVHPAVLMDKIVKRREAVTEEISAKLRMMSFGSLRAKIFRFVADYCLRFLKYRDDERHFTTGYAARNRDELRRRHRGLAHRTAARSDWPRSERRHPGLQQHRPRVDVGVP
jgi:hypothetical protein